MKDIDKKDVLKKIYNRIDRFKESVQQECFNIAINDLKHFESDLKQLKKKKFLRESIEEYFKNPERG